MKDFLKVMGGFVAVWATTFLLFGFAPLVFFPIPAIQGRIEAKLDVGHGRYKELAYGLPFRGSDEYARLLKERYGIEFNYVDFCTVSPWKREYADAYDKISIEAAKRKFGHDVFKETWEEIAKSGGADLPAR